ncbi:tetratricopeptide repeat protein, partial [Microcoleus sp. PH2017_05_CCC_O_A]|uniref:tetratricopeptide repeat protein n=1 Tax=Microcoleus sp. PH2017_05_CCC_O_A TaxID=2798816 RepID=UPI001DEFA9DF
GLTAISASGDKTLKIWDTQSGTELLTLTGHTNSVTAVAIAPDGLTAISASRDNTLKIWDLLSGKEIASFSGEDSFNGCAISPDGMSIVAGDASGRVHFLRLEGMKQGDGRDTALQSPYQPNNPLTLFYSGFLLAKQGLYEAALPKLTEVAELRPDVAVVWFELGNILDNLQRYEGAIASFDKALEIEREGGNRKFWFDRGLALMKCDSQDAVRASWDRAMSIEPDDSDFWSEQGEELFNSECYEPAICCFDFALQIQPNQAYLWSARGFVLASAGRNEEAIYSYDRALELEPNDCDILCYRAYGLVMLGRYEEAIDCFDKALEINPDYASVYYDKACCYALQSNVELSVENLRRTIELEPERCRELAKTDADFDGIRGDARFQELLLGG